MVGLKRHLAEELLPWLQAGPAPVEFSAFGEQPALLLDLASAQSFGRAQELAGWLPSLACPVIGLRDLDVSSCRHPAEGAVAAACDLVVDCEEDVVPLWERIARFPIAAASFVELLRITQNMTLDAALAAESAVFAALQGGREYARWLAGRELSPEPAQDDGPAVIAQGQGECLELILNRPSNRNAMSVEMRDALVEALRAAALEGGFRDIRISGRGPSFSTGGDLREFGTVPDAASGHLIRRLTVPGRFLAPLAARATVRVHGACVGSGIEFPAFAGRIVARTGSWFQLPEIGMGLIPGAGGCISIARRIGRQRLAWMGLSGRRLDAEMALAWGLIDEIEEED